MFDRGTHELVISRMKFDEIDAMTVAIMAGKYRFVLVGEKPRFHQRPARQCAIGVDPRLGPTGAKTPRPLL